MGSPPSPPSEAPHDLECLTIAELERQAYHRMDKQTREYYNEGADSCTTLRENISAYGKYRIRPRVLRDVSVIDTRTRLFGQEVSVPIGVAPTAMQCLAHPDGEGATAKACSNAGWAMGLSSFSTKNLEDVAEAMSLPQESVGIQPQRHPTPPRVLQLYLFEEREHSSRLIQRAKRAGYKAVFLTVDTPILGRRNADIRNRFSLPKNLRFANFSPQEEKSARETIEASNETTGLDRKKTQDTSNRRNESKKGYNDKDKRYPPSGPISVHTHAANPTVSWEKDVGWLKEQCGPEMEVWIKGIATAEDAVLALHYGVQGIIVSNHGGRQLDGALATLDALPEVVHAVGGKIPVHIDGGIRHGTDVFKAIALGADFVWVGRPVLWGLAYKGQEGVELCLRLLADELKLCMGLAGTLGVKNINKNYLGKVDSGGFVSKL